MVVSLHRSPRRALYSQRAQSSSVWLLGAETAPRVTGKLTSRLAGRQGPIADGMQRAWRVREGAEGVYQEGQAWVTSFSDCFTLSMGGGGGGGAWPTPTPHFLVAFWNCLFWYILGSSPYMGVLQPSTWENPCPMECTQPSWPLRGPLGCWGLSFTEDWNFLLLFPSL